MKTLADSFFDELAKIAAGEARINATDIKKAKLDVALMRKIKRTSGFKAMMGGDIRRYMRKLSLDTIHLARRKNPKLTIKQWSQQLLDTLSTRRIKMRKQIEKELVSRYTQK
jgi:hypothetical protein